MYKKCYFKEIQQHFWFVILLLITNHNVFTQTKILEINTLKFEFTSEIRNSEKVFIKMLSDFRIENKAQSKKNKHSNTRIRYDFIVITGLLFIILGLLFFLKKNRRKNLEILRLKEAQISRRNEALNELYSEKEWLLKELHHRVKNNLQIVISLLNTQSAYLENKEALLAIQDSQNRMYVMAIIHQKLYQNENLSTIDMNWYIPELADYLKSVFDTANKITCKLDIEHVELESVQAIPLGLILNEAIVNAIKYAYPEKEGGEVHIQLKEIREEEYQLIISDNGVGVPDDFDFKNRNSLGMNLMQGLSAQIDGKFNIENKNGLHISINFKAAKNHK